MAFVFSAPSLPVEPLSLPVSPASSDYDSLLPKHDIYRPIRGIPGSRSRVRPALPTTYLPLAAESNGPWKPRDMSSAPKDFVVDIEMDDVFLQRLSETTLNSASLKQSSGSNSGASSSAQSSLLATPTPPTSSLDPFRFSSTFAHLTPAADENRSSLQTSLNGKRSPPAYEADDELLPSTYLTPNKAKPSVSSGLKPWTTPETDREASERFAVRGTPTRSLGRSVSVTRRVPALFRTPGSKSLSGVVRLVSEPERKADNSVLHIRLPGSPKPFANGEPLNLDSAPKAKRQRTRSEAKAALQAKVREKNLQIRLEDPKAKTAAVALDGLFGVGKEESKAARCGYAGLGMAADKQSWKRTEDYETLLGATSMRSSVYNYAGLRSPRSPRLPHRRRRSSCPSTPGSVGYRSRSGSVHQHTYPAGPAIRVRKAPPPPLDLSKVSSFNLRKAEQRNVKRKAVPEPVIVGKASRILLNPIERELHSRAAEGGLKVLQAAETQQGTVGKTLRGILRSVRSISNMRAAGEA